jgi:hypothetical protein
MDDKKSIAETEKLNIEKEIAKILKEKKKNN